MDRIVEKFREYGIPFGIGMWVGMSYLGFGMGTSLLLSCILASHTLVAYPIVGRYGMSRHASVSISIGGTMFALTVALFILAGISGMYKGELDSGSWIWFIGKCVGYCVFVFLVFPRFARWFFRNYEDNVMQYIFVLSLVFLSAALAELAGMEGIFGAFLAGLVLNRFIPHVSPLMNRTEFVGNAFGEDASGKEIPIFAVSLARFAVSFKEEKGDFIARNILMEQKDATEKRIVPIALVDRGVMRAGMDIYCGDQHIGWVTSGTMVPYYVFEGDEPTDKTGKRSIGFAYIDRNITDGITIDVRGKRLKAKIVEKHMDQTGPKYGKAVL